MSYRCDLCNKGKQIGRQSRHRKGVAGKQWAKRAQKTLRVFKPNLQWVTVEGAKLKLCSNCIKLLKTNQAVKSKVGVTDEKVVAAVVA